MKCQVCLSDRVLTISSRKNTRGDRLKRFECRVCRHRWGSRNGSHESHHERWTEIDWRVPASEGCKECVHYSGGFCSLGLPEAREPGFVTECEARMVKGVVCVVQ